MAAPEGSTVTRQVLSQIGLRLPFFGEFVLFDHLSSARQVKAIRRRLAKTPSDAHLRLSLASSLVGEGKNEEALAEWHKAHLELPFDEDVQDNPTFSQKNAWSHYIFGLILRNKGALEEAAAEWKKASALDKYGVGDLARGKLEKVSA